MVPSGPDRSAAAAGEADDALVDVVRTALTEAPEFFDIYKMNVVSIPTNVAVQRTDEDDEFYKNITDKFAAIAKEIKGRQEKGQPVLVGTVSIEKSETLSELLKTYEYEVPVKTLKPQHQHLLEKAGSDDEKVRREAKKAWAALKDEDFDIEVRTAPSADRPRVHDHRDGSELHALAAPRRGDERIHHLLATVVVVKDVGGEPDVVVRARDAFGQDGA